MTLVLETVGVEAALDRFFEERLARARQFGESHEVLWQRISAACRGGKLVRPRLVLLAHTHFGGHDPAAVDVAAAFELLHTALLVHDDLLDGDLRRRGAPNLAGEYVADALATGVGTDRAAEWSRGSALLAGDLLLSAVHALIARTATPATPALHDIVDEALEMTAAGEHADVGFAVGTLSVTPEGIRQMMAHKTAAYSFCAPLRAGALLAGVDDESAVTTLTNIGTQLGVMYQLRDDVLGAFGDEAKTGKSTLGDLREGKATLLIALAKQHPGWAGVEHLFGSADLDESGAQLIRAVIVESGALDAVEEEINERRAQVGTVIADSGFTSDFQSELETFADACVERGA
ncbi:polyprenyl synthetase family protein [Microbacterium amylolyticum]|uniref:Geranylgeranyl diphosphate synthase type II n=1 Tax=Microbacterium amylolyticum TaxID=936337 RepID=A0ABS4ZF22_9MICO|nr:polyprenyl synthetase family protein [Microbacterium amylolyticum]MBP2435874.1 geranylgeranyl diphosphate synthase type II [Microbacterium amylolyticum]